MPLNPKKYGWKPQLPDVRDLKLAPTELTLKELPVFINLQPLCPPVYDQGQENSCVGHGCDLAVEYIILREKKPWVSLSRNFIYWNARFYDNNTSQDNGAEVRNGIKGIAQYGACPETDWPYLQSNVTTQPSAEAFAAARNDIAIKYLAVNQTIEDLLARLASGYPVVFGFTVYSAFESDQVANTGTLNMPEPTESVVGGHCVALVGYNQQDKHFIVRNSWGTDWGMQGYFTMPFEYVISPDLASDFWTIELV